MKIRVCVKDKQIDVQCGDGPQSILWLANVGISRYDSNEGITLGRPVGVRLEDGSQLPLDGKIGALLQDGSQVFVILKQSSELDSKE